MKKVLFFILFSLVAFFATTENSFALRGTTVKGHVACFRQAWLDDLHFFATDQDVRSYQKYLTSRKCTILRGGLPIVVTDTPGIFGSVAGFEIYGVKLWTDLYGIKYD